MATTNNIAIPVYDHYFTSVDVTIDISYPTTNKRVNIDKAVAIAYTHNVSSIPVYTLGSSVPFFYSKGNSLVQGQLDLAFKSTDYLRTALNYLVDSETNVMLNYRGLVANPSKYDPLKTKISTLVDNDEELLRELAELNNEEYGELQNTLKIQNITIPEKSLLNVQGLFNIIITYDNGNSNMPGSQSIITLEGVKFTSQSSAINSQDDTALVDRFSFMARNIK